MFSGGRLHIDIDRPAKRRAPEETPPTSPARMLERKPRRPEAPASRVHPRPRQGQSIHVRNSSPGRNADRRQIQMGVIGQPLLRKEDLRLLTGKGRFSDDFRIGGQAYAAIVRSPYPHARIVRVKAENAKAMAGVLGVFTGADCRADGLAPIPHSPVPSTRYDLKLTGPGGGAIFFGPQPLLPVDRVRHVGEAVAMVVAETLPQALDAAEAVEIECQELPRVTNPRAAILPGAPPVWDEVPDNVFVDTMFGDRGATDRAFAEADHFVEMDLHIGRVTGVPLEPRAALVLYDPASGRYTLYAGSGGPVRQKAELAAVLGVAPEKVRVVSYDVSGNFGVRNRLFVEFGLVAWAARRLGRPVKFTATRSEAFLSDFQGRDLVTKVTLALRADGRFLALRADNVSNVGGRCVSLSPLGKGSALVTGSYDIPAANLRSRAVFTNTMPTNAYRSSGRPEVTYAIERLVDKAARELGFDRVELRRKNLVGSQMMPYPNAVGARYDSGTYESNMDLAMRNADWDGFAARRREAEALGKLLGLGLANYVESSIGAPNERTEITVTPAGRVEVVIGTGPSGQGHETSFAQVVSALLSVPAARILEADPSEVGFEDGRFAAPRHNRSFDFLELAAEAARLGLADGLAI